MHSPSFSAPRRMRATAALIGSTALLLAGASAAQAACAVTPTKKAFSTFGDKADYTLAPGGSFEFGTPAWSLKGAAIGSGNETFKVGSSSDSRSLALSATGTAVSPSFCIGVEHPTFRLFARRTSGTWAQLAVKLRWTEASGKVNETVVAGISGNASTLWAPSASIPLATTLPIWKAGQSVTGQIVLDPEDSGGAWQIDDVYVDPYRRS